MNRTVRSIPSEFLTREEGDSLVIEGYFAVYDSNYEIAPGMTESIARGAFSRSLSNDVRALINHDTTLVVGRTKAGTLRLDDRERGLWGRIDINRNDTDAVNAWHRVSRGDVDGCSFGFDIVSQETEFREDGSIHWTLTDVELYEVSICTFPAYSETNISARSAERDNIKARALDAWRAKMKGRLQDGT